MDPPGRHGVERAHGHGLGGEATIGAAVAQGLAQRHVHEGGLGELRRAAEAAPLGVEPRGQLGHRRGQQVGHLAPQPVEQRGPVRTGLDGRAGGDGPGQLVGLRLDLGAAVVPDVADGTQHGGERGAPRQVPGREVGTAEERAPVGGEEDAHRPAARAGHGLDRLHVDGVDVGALLAVDLDADEAGVEQLGHHRVLEGLVCHDVAPVAGRVPDGQEDRPVLGRRPVEGLLAPRVPVDRIAGVLAQVGARLVGQAVGGHPRKRTQGVSWSGRRKGARGARVPGGEWIDREQPRAVRRAAGRRRARPVRGRLWWPSRVVGTVDDGATGLRERGAPQRLLYARPGFGGELRGPAPVPAGDLGPDRPRHERRPGRHADPRRPRGHQCPRVDRRAARSPRLPAGLCRRPHRCDASRRQRSGIRRRVQPRTHWSSRRGRRGSRST